MPGFGPGGMLELGPDGIPGRIGPAIELGGGMPCRGPGIELEGPGGIPGLGGIEFCVWGPPGKGPGPPIMEFGGIP